MVFSAFSSNMDNTKFNPLKKYNLSEVKVHHVSMAQR